MHSMVQLSGSDFKICTGCIDPNIQKGNRTLCIDALRADLMSSLRNGNVYRHTEA